MSNEKLRGLVGRYLDTLPARWAGMQEVAAWFQSAVQTGIDVRTDDRFAQFRRDAHQLAGSGGSMGYPELGRTALMLDVTVSALAERATPPGSADVEQITLLLDPLGRAMKGLAIDDSTLLAPVQDGPVAVLLQPGAIPPGFGPPGLPPRLRLRLGTEVILVSRDGETIRRLTDDLHPFGLTLYSCPSLDLVATALSGMTTLVVVDRDACPDGLPEPLTLGLPADLPVTVLDADGSLDHRVRAHRAGAMAFLTKPVNAAAIIDLLERLHTAPDEPPPRVVMLDDDDMMLALCAHAFHAAGMECVTVARPADVLDVLAEFHPDILVIDRQMPDYDGLDVAAAIRQQPGYTSLPVVFLTQDASGHGRLEAMAAGADGYIIKPVDMDVLVGLVHYRVRRARELRALITRDALCNLLNHGAFVTQLERDLALVRRTGLPLSVALLDLDHFKTINDTYGHQTGDAVLQGFSRLLRQRMRKTDSIGRLGGEEFAVILSGATAEQAHQVVEDVLDAFRGQEQAGPNQTFRVTFSAGIAAAEPGRATVKDLLQAADTALYAAKNSGRNRVMLHQPDTTSANGSANANASANASAPA